MRVIEAIDGRYPSAWTRPAAAGPSAGHRTEEPAGTTSLGPGSLSGAGRRALNFAVAAACGYCPASPNASATAVIPAASAKGRLKITSSAPASM